eukprot:TRINITY_DN38766_c0_g1_i1.p1 TRINITY_DN38766_c0_g1~~TRINITY_DN38766_c0_g1_i1.p1  ORF type:complete len:435 (-),score=120.29 TRINITY_DN38766_c0_g1_i1:52-1356(-)
MVKNIAFVFIKPHAVTDKVKELVKETLEKKGFEIRKEGSKEAEEIDKKELVDKHYYAIASKATLLTPDQLAIPKEKFSEKFGADWDTVVKDGKALNAKDACAKFDITADALDKLWGECKKAGNLVKFGGGFYCGKLPLGGDDYYVFNGFFMTMRSKFVEPGSSIYYYVVEWEQSAYSWEDFRGKVLGPTDPNDAPEDSLRGAILKKWKDLDLKSMPNTGDNGVHASASPFEALAERVNWLGDRVEKDPFGKQLLKSGVSKKQVKEWSLDPQVTFGPVPITRSLYDSLEDTDSDYCLALCQMIGGQAVPAANVDTLTRERDSLLAEIEKYRALEKAVLCIQSHIPPKETKEPKGSKSGGGDGDAHGKEKGKGGEKEKDKGKGSKSGGGKSGKGGKAAEEERPPMRNKSGGGKGGSGKGGGGGGKGGKNRSGKNKW